MLTLPRFASVLFAFSLPVGAQCQPDVDWGHLLGGPGQDEVRSGANGALLANGDVIVSGLAGFMPPTAPVTCGPAHAGGADGYLAMLRWPAGYGSSVLRWSRFIGGSGDDWINAVHVDQALGRVYAVGRTFSPDLPVTANAVQPFLSGASDAFLAVVDFGSCSPCSCNLVYLSYLGGTSDDALLDLAVDARGVVTAVGVSFSVNWPGVQATVLQPALAGKEDAVIVRWNPWVAASNQISWSTYLGGADSDFATRVELLPGGDVIACGETHAGSATTFPSTVSPYMGGVRDAFVARLAPTATGMAQLVWSTFVGGQGSENANALVVDGAGQVMVGGWTSSPAMPLSCPSQPGVAGAQDGYVLQLDAVGNPQWGTYLGGSADDGINDIAVDSAGVLTVTGSTASPNLPTTAGAFATTRAAPAGKFDAFVARIEPPACALGRPARLEYASYLGGAQGGSSGLAVGITTRGGAVVCGWTDSPSFPSNSIGAGGRDLFVRGFTMQPAGVVSRGPTSPNCGRPVFAGVTEKPCAGSSSFALVSTGMLPNAPGACAFGGLTYGCSGIAVLGSTLSIAPIIVLPVLSAAGGRTELPIPLQGVPVGATVACQFLWLNTTGGCAAPSSATQALTVSVR